MPHSMSDAVRKAVQDGRAFLMQSLFRRVLFSFFAIIFGTVFTIVLYYYIQTSSYVKTREVSKIEMLNAQSASKLETQMANISSTAWNYFADQRFQKFVMTLGSDLNAYNEFSGNFSQFVTDHPEVEFFVVTQLEGNRLIKGNINSTEVVDFEEMKSIAIANNGKGAWVSSIAFDRETGRQANTLTYVQAVKDIRFVSRQSPIVGVLMIQLSYDYLREWLAGIGKEESLQFYLADAETGRIMVAADPAMIGTRLEGLPASDEPHDHIRWSRYKTEKMLFVSHALAKTSWVLVGSAEVDALLSEVNVLARNIVLIGVLALLGGMLVASLLSSRILNPLKMLKKGIHAVENGDYNLILPVHSMDEIGYIIHRFNQMTKEIKSLIQKVYETDLGRKEAELRSLQSQINPHFLYNTLGMIDSLAVLHEDDRISRISRALAKMFRYSISADRVSSLQSEIRQAELYLYIQQQRYGDRFQYAIDVPERLHDLRVPKLLFQPLIENCFVHAFDRMSASCELRIKAWEDPDGRLYVSIWNNGPPIPPEVISRLRRELNHGQPQRTARPQGSSIGLLNVAQRIQLFYGPEYGLSIRSQDGEGTEVIVELRRIEAEGDGHETVDRG